MRLGGKRLLLIAMLLLLGLLPRIMARAEETEAAPHSTTVMIYLCGSDLESRFGSATRDLAEMLASGFDPAYTKVLVMGGGSGNWKLAFDTESTSIAELGTRGLRTVWRSEAPLNMAKSDTLAAFLRYAFEHYETERYALILWDHGGGPNEGLCFDELFGGESLSLRALRDALSETNSLRNSQKLSWIGFDACLMANVETGYMLADYASYMIASQAQEPSGGWDYAFLKGLERDEDAVATARRILAAYAESTAGSPETITLSCVDLGRIWEVRSTMDAFFDGLYPALSDESYSAFSRARHQPQGFGRAEYNADADLDLVDLLALTEAYEQAGVSGEALKTAISRAVVCSYSNSESAHGLSVYHPCYNRTGYTADWAESYPQQYASMSQNYMAYLRRFGRILTGTQLGDWSGLETQRIENGEGEISFSVTLSEEQAANFEHATLMIIKQVYTDNQGLGNTFYQIWETPYLELDENNTLCAAYPQKTVCVADENGNPLTGPVEYNITREGQLQIHVLHYDDKGILDPDLLDAMYFCSFAEDSDAITVDRICAFDEATQEFSPRMAVDEAFFASEDYTNAVFLLTDRVRADKGDELPGYREWAPGDSIIYSVVNLPCDWHFAVEENERIPEILFAMFQITDTQNVVHSSKPVRIHPEQVEAPSVRLIDVPGDGALRVEAGLERFLETDSLCLSFRFPDPPAELYAIEGRDLVLNDSYHVDGWLFTSDNTLRLTLEEEQLRALNELRNLSFTLSLEDVGFQSFVEGPLRLELEEPLLLDHGGREALCTVESEEGLIWKIWGVEQRRSGEIDILYELFNPTGETRIVTGEDFIVEDYATNYVGLYFEVEAGQSRLGTIEVFPSKSELDDSFRTVTVIHEPLARLGVESIRSLRMPYRVREGDRYLARELVFELEEPVPYEPVLSETPLWDRKLAEDGQVGARLVQPTAFTEPNGGMEVLGLGLLLENRSADAQELAFKDFLLDGEHSMNEDYLHSTSFALPGNSCSYVYLQIELPAGRENTGTVSFSLYAGERFVRHITLTLEELFPAES